MKYTENEKIEIEELTSKILKCLEGTHYRIAYAALNDAKHDLAQHAIIGGVDGLVIAAV